MSKQLKAAPGVSLDASEQEGVRDVVRTVIEEVRREGDTAVRKYSAQFDNWSPDSFLLGRDQAEEIVAALPQQVVSDILEVQANVRHFAQLQLESMHSFESEVSPGVFLGQKHLPIRATGAYVPGGRYALTASAHMTVVTAKVAGVERVTACTPPIRGELPVATIAALHLAGADEILMLGGVQAVAALALGTETIGRVDLLAGPGNAYVAEAKRQLFGRVGIDLLAGPTEVLVIADATADAELVAADLLGQAEHGPTSPAVLVTTARPFGLRVLEEIGRLLEESATADVAAEAWRAHGEVLVARDREEAVALADARAPEHLEVQVAEDEEAAYADALRNYGSLFLGARATVAYGDKAVGTNHVLPTARAARYTGGLWVGKFLKTVTVQELGDEGTRRIAPATAAISHAEGFGGHARTAELRLARAGGER